MALAAVDVTVLLTWGFNGLFRGPTGVSVFDVVAGDVPDMHERIRRLCGELSRRISGALRGHRIRGYVYPVARHELISRRSGLRKKPRSNAEASYRWWAVLGLNQ